MPNEHKGTQRNARQPKKALKQPKWVTKYPKCNKNRSRKEQRDAKSSKYNANDLSKCNKEQKYQVYHPKKRLKTEVEM